MNGIYLGALGLVHIWRSVVTVVHLELLQYGRSRLAQRNEVTNVLLGCEGGLCLDLLYNGSETCFFRNELCIDTWKCMTDDTRIRLAPFLHCRDYCTARTSPFNHRIPCF